jgi:hypothetical protein
MANPQFVGLPVAHPLSTLPRIRSAHGRGVVKRPIDLADARGPRAGAADRLLCRRDHADQMTTVHPKRLFGVRGGGKVDEDLRARDTSWQAIERAPPTAIETAV